jgi:hypothetical protein
MVDPIVAEVRKVREAHAAAFKYDLAAICRALREEEVGWVANPQRITPAFVDLPPNQAIAADAPRATRARSARHYPAARR